MADDEQEVEVEQKQKKKERPVRRLLLRECDAPKTLADDIIEVAQQALDDAAEGAPGVPGMAHKDAAQRIKQRLDKEKSGSWHVIVGSHFGGNVTNDANSLVNFQLDGTWFLVFRSGPPEKLPEAHSRTTHCKK